LLSLKNPVIELLPSRRTTSTKTITSRAREKQKEINSQKKKPTPQSGHLFEVLGGKFSTACFKGSVVVAVRLTFAAHHLINVSIFVLSSVVMGRSLDISIFSLSPSKCARRMRAWRGPTNETSST
jgi:hypothetical protein